MSPTRGVVRPRRGAAERRETQQLCNCRLKRRHEQLDVGKSGVDAHAEEHGGAPAQRAHRKRDAWRHRGSASGQFHYRAAIYAFKTRI